jgi:glycosyltransferase involved in cell wall biosynthesis
LNVALLAATCDGKDVGESWSSFQWASGLAERCELTVLTYTRPGHVPTSQQLPNARVIEWGDAPVLGRFERFGAIAKPGWWLFYWRARRWLKAAIRRGERFDLIHQVSPLALRHACPAAGLGVPSIIGPLAGSLPTPEAFRGEVASGAWYTRLRALDAWRFRHDPLLRRGLRDASAVIGVAPYVAELLRAIPLRRFEVMAETGVHRLPDTQGRPAGGDSPVRLLYVGRIVRTKGLRDAIRALALLPDSCEVHLDAVGDGEDRAACEAEAQRLGVGSRVTFHGKVPRERVDGFYERADVFVFPSFREPSGNVVFEAMSFGLPVITAANGGPGFLVDASCGITIPPERPDQFATDIAEAIARLSSDEQLRVELGSNARDRVGQMALWPNKIDWMMALYHDLAESGGTRR